MIEYHGWVTLRETPAETEDEGEASALNRLSHIKNMLQELIDEIKNHHTFIGFNDYYGEYSLSFTGQQKRRNRITEAIFELLKLIAEIAPGSYGLLYLHDDESVNQYNEFQVWKLARGSLTKHSDPFLSPYIPTVEDIPLVDGEPVDMDQENDT